MYSLPDIGVVDSNLGEAIECAYSGADGTYTLQATVGADVIVRLKEDITLYSLEASTAAPAASFVTPRTDSYDVRDINEDVLDLDFALTSEIIVRLTHGGGAHRCLAPIGVGTFSITPANGNAACALLDPEYVLQRTCRQLSRSMHACIKARLLFRRMII